MSEAPERTMKGRIESQMRRQVFICWVGLADAVGFSVVVMLRLIFMVSCKVERGIRTTYSMCNLNCCEFCVNCMILRKILSGRSNYI